VAVTPMSPGIDIRPLEPPSRNHETINISCADAETCRLDQLCVPSRKIQPSLRLFVSFFKTAE
jgi:hypothetical protein